MSRIMGLARSPIVRWGFLIAALGLAAWAVLRDWDSIQSALVGIGWPLAVAATSLSFLYVLASMESWRSVLADIHAKLPWRDSAEIFLTSQLGKYIPGGVWNVVAGAELAKDRGISRARAAGTLAMTMLVSVLVGGALAGVGAAFAPHTLPGWVRLFGLATPVCLALLAPPLLTRALHLGLRLLRRPDTDLAFSGAGIARAAGWSLVAWLLAGAQVWLIGIGLGLPATLGTFTVAAGGFAGAWLVGLAALFMPAGIGARELVLIPVFSGLLDQAEVLVLVLLSRVLFTVADVTLAGVPLLWRRRKVQHSSS
ncbi:lysylphosphatidylglycerol synthase domain-containing protein [Demequina capsici]|uniref:Lysylphosphatidylglycerol synthase domain-containing protein n=1 Tax=Demequina capsici TaxID=3075620 RepID=A0AA96FA07_9MICO|nr:MULTISPECIES: lysylphosphatidylglycerol synthase domain-containing protein [unclassified Demequina]WNM24365.1 lysylphosphatidylglycerol synthase domain-containing protein [Demequina sp. OYTSA14]WNM27187.1 lysylphosphatidylglycerol synthase domain-containing protein [Demequina sp. PMTSA13]